jgi:hypothetical protein
VNGAQENRAQTRELICKNTISGLPLIFSGENMKWVNPVQHPKIHTWTESNPDFCLNLKFTAPPTFQHDQVCAANWKVV